MHAKDLPDFDELPCVPGHPEIKGCAWGLHGTNDNLGTLNLLTPEVVASAARECIQTGVAVRLDLPLNFPSVGAFGRHPLKHTVLAMKSKAARDDELSFNTQASSQWDGLRHYGVTDIDAFYGGLPESEVRIGESRVLEGADLTGFPLSIHHWAERGINGRGILLDVGRFAPDIGLPDFDPYGGVALTAQQLNEVAAREGVSFNAGDILVVRVGSTKAYMQMTEEQRGPLRSMATGQFSGVEQSDDMRRFLWNNHFSALVSDSMSFEKMPPPPGVKMLHQSILGCWGCPMGELFDLEKLSETCARLNRYIFFFTSAPLYVVGGIASPPNAQALF